MYGVVCINSSVGFEAMILGKYVVNCGESLYNTKRFLPSIEELADGIIDRAKYTEQADKTISLLLNYYLHQKESALNFNKFIKNIEYNIRLWKIFIQDKNSFFSDFTKHAESLTEPEIYSRKRKSSNFICSYYHTAKRDNKEIPFG